MAATNIASFVSPLDGQLTFSSYGRVGSGTMYIRLINASLNVYPIVGTLTFTSSSWSTKETTVAVSAGQAYFIEVEILENSEGASFNDIIFKTNTPMTQTQRNIASMGFSL
jgi:hypothetical protein